MTPHTRKRLFTLLAISSAFLGVGAIALHLSLPAIARSQIKSSLAKAGFDDATFTVVSANLHGVRIKNLRAGKHGELTLPSARVAYQPLVALTKKIDALRIEGASLTIDLDAAAGDAGNHFDAWTAANEEGLPLWRIEMSGCSLVFKRDGEQYTVRADGWLWRHENQRAKMSLRLMAAGAPAWLEGSVDFALRRFDASAGAEKIDLQKILPFLPASITRSIDEATGQVSVLGAINYASGRADTQATVELHDAHVVTSEDIGLVMDGVNTKLVFSSLSPPRAARGQAIDIRRVALGTNAITDLHVEFGIDQRDDVARTTNPSLTDFTLPSTVLIEALRFSCAGGSLASEGPVVVNPNERSLAFTLAVRGVGLNEVLKLVSGERLSGNGTLSGNLPIRIEWPSITFGTGSIATDAPGDLNFGEKVSEMARTVAENDKRLNGQEEQLVAALTHFRYDRIAFDFERTDEGLKVTTSIAGRGSQGVSTPIELTVHYKGLEEALNAYLSANMRVNTNDD